MLVCDSLEHFYGRSRVLAGVYLTCEPGEVVGVVGRNGCGKTTMLRAIFGDLRATHLHLTVDDRLCRQAYRSGVVRYLPQDPFLPRGMRVRRAVSLLTGDRAVGGSLESHPFVGPLMDRRVRDLSGGEQRYLEVLLVATLRARYCLLDEPFTEIEPINRIPLGESLREIASREGRGLIITDHAYRNVLETSDRVVVLADGVIRPVAREEDLKSWGYTP